MLRNLTTLALGAVCASAMAQMTPVGLWKTIDDKDGTVKSEIRIVEKNGVISGKVERILDPTAKPGDTCTECEDERKDQPILGMEVLRGLKKASDKDVWEGGNILDPKNGKIYRATVTPIDGGQKLQMRGYIAFFYRTQTWIRVQ
ncbi:MAG: DUF2147 domain-containing protein [Rhodoferax sp.]|jgi:uncharacterized protein (DUF2147 family)